jgi:SAM-dependent methyltransferase
LESNIKSDLNGLERMRSVTVSKGNQHYIVLSQLNEWVASCAAPMATGVLLDYGCGGQPYKAIFEPYITKYIGADVATANGILLDVELEVGKQAPLQNESIDTILSTQVLEHIYDFQSYLSDCARLLRPSGRIIISVPMQWRHHEVPYDYWRFTKYGLIKSLESKGFRILEIQPCGGVYSLLGQVFLDHLSRHKRFSPSITKWINTFAIWLDKKVEDTDDTLAWMCIAEKSNDTNHQNST